LTAVKGATLVARGPTLKPNLIVALSGGYTAVSRFHCHTFLFSIIHKPSIVDHAWERCEMYIKFLSENLKGRDHSEDLGVDGRIILE
jgi:hypothetical protein